MNITKKALLGFILLAGSLAAQIPSFTGVVNAGSNLPPGFPNSGLAQGSIIVIYGSNLGPASLVKATTLPFPTTAGLGGTVVTITVGGTTVTAPIDYTSAGQVAAVVPSITPLGNGMLTVSYNQNSGSTPVTIVASNFGIVTVNNSGAGQAVVTFANNSEVSNTNSAKPGDELVMWGTGLGAESQSESSPTGAAGGNLPAQIQVFVGGISAQIAYQGRTPTAVGLDQINFFVPPNAPLGCNVGVVVQTTTPTATVSNAPTISLASADGATCTDPVDVFVPSLIASKNSLSVVGVAVNQTASTSPNGNGGITTSTSATGTAFFFQITPAQISTYQSTAEEASLGSCYVQVLHGSGPASTPVATYLSAGASVVLTPPLGNAGNTVPLVSQGLGIYGAILSAVPVGLWGFSNGNGGSQVHAVTSSFPVPQSITWTNENTLALGPAIDRTQPLTITWNGGDNTNGFVDIEGSAVMGPSNSPTYTIGFDCSALTSATQFTIPPSILLAMPTGASAFASITVSTVSYPFTMSAIPGFDVAINNSKFKATIPVIFK